MNIHYHEIDGVGSTGLMNDCADYLFLSVIKTLSVMTYQSCQQGHV